jgi:hypothetical protein
VDATGTVVVGAVSTWDGAAINYFDSDGIVWIVDPIAGEIPLSLLDQVVSSTAYETIDCTGTAYYFTGSARLPVPRFPFSMGEVGGPLKIRLDNAFEYNIQYCSVRGIVSGDCIPVDPCIERSAILATDTADVTMPVLSYVPPFHPEYR